MTQRLNYFYTHLTFSVLLSFLILIAIIFFWYPYELMLATGVEGILLFLCSINITLGPLLSLFIYKSGKKKLKFDLSIIIVIQLIILSYGIYTIERGRPIWIVYSVDRFQLIRQNEVVDLADQKTVSSYKRKIWQSPEYVAVQLSKIKEQKEDDMFKAIFGLTLAHQPSRYIPFSAVESDLKKNVQDLNLLKNYNEKDLLENILKKNPRADSWLPLKANALDMVVLINKEKAEVVKIVDLRPWN